MRGLAWFLLLVAVLAACGDSSDGDTDAALSGDGATADGSADADTQDASETYSISGMVNGLVGSGLRLELNGDEELAIPSNGPFAFTTRLNDGVNFQITVSSQPSAPNQTCEISNDGAGTIVSADVEIIVVTCETNTYSVGGRRVRARRLRADSPEQRRR